MGTHYLKCKTIDHSYFYYVFILKTWRLISYLSYTSGVDMTFNSLNEYHRYEVSGCYEVYE